MKQKSYQFLLKSKNYQFLLKKKKNYKDFFLRTKTTSRSYICRIKFSNNKIIFKEIKNCTSVVINIQEHSYIN